MLQLIPTYRVRSAVTVAETNGNGRHQHVVDFRVPQTDLEAFLRTLIFNDVRDFSVVLESEDPR